MVEIPGGLFFTAPSQPFGTSHHSVSYFFVPPRPSLTGKNVGSILLRHRALKLPSKLLLFFHVLPSYQPAQKDFVLNRCNLISSTSLREKIMSLGGTQSSFRKALGALKDSTTVSLAKVNSGYKELDIAIVKATNHVERPAKERHIRAIFSAISATRPRADVAYCIHALAKRLSKTHNWAVALKTLIVVHRALREVDPTFHEELINYGKRRNHMLNMAHFKDESSDCAWDYSAWVRAYGLYLEERLECFRVLGYDVETDRIRTGELETAELLVELPMLQQLLYRILCCEPRGAAVHNLVIRFALSLVASETVKIYQAITAGINNLVDKFFEMQRSDAIKGLDVYSKASRQAEKLSEFYESCRSMDIGRRDQFVKIEQPPASFLQTMEEYVNNAPHNKLFRDDARNSTVADAPKEILAIEYKKEELPPEPEPEKEQPPPPPEPEKTEIPVVQPPDLLNMSEPSPAASEMFEQNAMALAIVPVDASQSTAAAEYTASNNWELALVSAPSSTSSTSKLAGGLDKLTLDSLYDDAIRRQNQTVGFNPWDSQNSFDPFAASNGVAPSRSVQMAAMANQQQAFMMQHPVNPFTNHYGSSNQYPSGYPYSSFL